MSASEAFQVALRLLARQGRSCADLEARLRRRGYDAAAVSAAVERCRELGYLDDARFARERAGALLRSGRAAGPRLLQDLQRRGIGRELAAEAAAEAGREVDSAELLRRLRARRFPDFVLAAATPQEKRRVVDFFLRRGFSLSLVLSILSEER